MMSVGVCMTSAFPLSKPRYKRVLIKLSGEALLGDGAGSIDPTVIGRLASELQELLEWGLQVCVVIGGGNIFRGAALEAEGLDRSTSDYMGMLATVMNALALQNVLEKKGISTRIQSALSIQSLCEPFIQRRAERHLEKNRLVIFAAGSGNPYFTTDTAAVLRAKEMSCDILLKGTKVDGVYNADPMIYPGAKRFTHLTYKAVLEEKLAVMDMTAIILARDHHLPIAVFSILEAESMAKVVQGQGAFTLIQDKE